MANKRMFSKAIIDSDMFLDMPKSAQALYFHLGMRADDDGFLDNAKKIMRSIGASEDDYKILVAKNYIIQMEKGICVITHWWVHNYIQRDRYKETIHLEEKALLTQTETGVYTLDTECVQPVSISASQIRLDKISIDKINNNIPASADAPLSPDVKVKHKYGEYKHVMLTDDEKGKLQAEYGEGMAEKAVTFLDEYIEMKGYKAKSHYLAIRKWVINAVKEAEQKDKGRTGKQKTNQFQQFPQREVDYDALVMQGLQNMGDGEHGKEI